MFTNYGLNMTLHTIANTTIDINLILPNDIILFWQNGVILTLRDNAIIKQIKTITPHCYALESDLAARGLTQLVDSEIKITDMLKVVKLTEKYSPQIAW